MGNGGVCGEAFADNRTRLCLLARTYARTRSLSHDRKNNMAAGGSTTYLEQIGFIHCYFRAFSVHHPDKDLLHHSAKGGGGEGKKTNIRKEVGEGSFSFGG